MKSKTRLRKALLFVIAFVTLLVVLLVATPLWFPWLLGPIGKHFGAHYSRFERMGYSRLAVESLTYSNAHVRLKAARVELFTPTVWAWKHLRRETNSNFARVSNWRLETFSTTNRTQSTSASVYTNLQKVGVTLEKINRWLPSAELSNGIVQFGTQSLLIGALNWQDANVDITLQRLGMTESLRLKTVATGSPVQRFKRLALHGESAPLGARTDLQVTTSASNLVISGAILVQTNRFDLNAEFGREGSLPKAATVECSSFSLPGAMLKLNSYGDVKGALAFVWNRTNFHSDLRANALPPPNSKFPPLNVALKVEGDLHHADVQQLKLLLPGFEAELSTNFTIPFGRGVALRRPRESAESPAVLKISADLRQQPWLAMQGTLQGTVTLSAWTNILPQAELTLKGTNIGTARFQARSLLVSAQSEWPNVVLREIQATLASNGVAKANATLDLARKEVRSGRLAYDGPLPPGLLPSGYKAESLSIAAEFAGPLTNLHHRADVQIRRLQSAQLQPINGDIAADGEGRTFHAKASLQAGASKVTASLSTSLSGGTNELRLNELALSTHAQTVLGLEQPVSVRLASTELADHSHSHELNFSTLKLSGGERQLSVEASLQWPNQGRCAGEAHKIVLDDFTDFVDPKWRGVRVQEMRFATEWRNGPASFFLVGNGSYSEGPGFTAEGQIRGDTAGILLSNIVISSQSAPVVNARGFLPVQLNPSSLTNFIAWRPGQTLDLKAKMQPDPAFWQRVRDITGIEVVRPELSVDVSGSWNSPTGWVRAAAARLSRHQTNAALPTIENLDLAAELNAQKVRLAEFRFLADKQPVEITAEMPLDAQFYQALARRELPDWQRATARVRIQRAPVATFARYLPKVLSPLGILDVDLRVEPGTNVQGDVLLHGATTQPIGPFGAIRDIDTHLRLAGQTVTLTRFNATIGGEAVQAVGTLDLRGMEWMNHQAPPFRLQLKGKNIPLVRQPEVILRADLDLSLGHARNLPPIITGTVNLRDSFYSSDLESLLPGRVAKASRRPPYFSVEAEGFADWKLDCRVTGKDFLKLRTPFVKATASAEFKLAGTLREPFASGEATISKGQIDFPFGSLEIKQVLVSLTAANPYQPTILATGRARRFGYDITMEVSGTGDKPVIQFSSVPSLSSEQILLLLTAGELPRDDLTFTPQQKAQRFAVFFGQRILSKLGFGGGAERLTIRSGEEVSESGRATYDVEYKIDRNWSLVGQYDRFNAFNLSIKRRLYSR